MDMRRTTEVAAAVEIEGTATEAAAPDVVGGYLHVMASGQEVRQGHGVRLQLGQMRQVR